MTLRYAQMDSPLGPMVLATQSDGLAGVWFVGQQHMPDMRDWQTGKHPVLTQTRQQLDEYFAGLRTRFDLPLRPAWGTEFQKAVWQALRRIPEGQTTHYGALAQELKRPLASRAVGAAVGRNPWTIIVPCHRVVGANGALTGYAGGLERKVALLQLEGLLL